MLSARMGSEGDGSEFVARNVAAAEHICGLAVLIRLLQSHGLRRQHGDSQTTDVLAKNRSAVNPILRISRAIVVSAGMYSANTAKAPRLGQL